MAKARAACHCAECGEIFIKTKTCNNRIDAENWVLWAEEHYTQCPSCWGKEQRANEESSPLKVTIGCDPYLQEVSFTLSGSTKPHKDKLKELGYRWGEVSAFGVLGILSMQSKLGWYKTISITNIEEIETEVKKLSELKPIVKSNVSKADVIALQMSMKKSREKQEEIDKLVKPIVPEIIKGHSWNCKVYGKSGNHAVYFEGDKVLISDEQASELGKYVEYKEKYKKQIEKIKNE